MLSHAEAKRIVDGLPEVSPVESLFLRAVALHETGYGSGWKPGRGAGSWNMGAITTLHPDGLSFAHQDSRFDDELGKVVQYVTYFAGWPTAEAGFRGLAKTILKPNVRAALECQDIQLGVAGMYENHYFLGLHTHANTNGDRLNLTDYYGAVAKCIASIGKETGEVHPVVLPPKIVRDDGEEFPLGAA